jgi:hypothetical protein
LTCREFYATLAVDPDNDRMYEPSEEETMTRIGPGLCVVFAALLLITSTGGAQEKTAATTRPRVEADEAMQKWMDTMSPGEEHRVLDQLVGLWNTTVRMWMEGPGSKPTETKGTATYKWVLKGHYVMQESKGQMMGLPHQGIGFLGYDKFRKQYTSVWMDNMSTAIYTMAGNFDPLGQALVLYGTMDEPMTGEVGKTVIYVIRIISEDKHIFEVRDPAFGNQDNMVVEVVYTRK